MLRHAMCIYAPILFVSLIVETESCVEAKEGGHDKRKPCVHLYFHMLRSVSLSSAIIMHGDKRNIIELNLRFVLIVYYYRVALFPGS